MTRVLHLNQNKPGAEMRPTIRSSGAVRCHQADLRPTTRAPERCGVTRQADLGLPGNGDNSPYSLESGSLSFLPMSASSWSRDAAHRGGKQYKILPRMLFSTANNEMNRTVMTTVMRLRTRKTTWRKFCNLLHALAADRVTSRAHLWGGDAPVVRAPLASVRHAPRSRASATPPVASRSVKLSVGAGFVFYLIDYINELLINYWNNQ